MKGGAILPHTRLYGGVKRFIELGRVFMEAGHSFTLYTPDGSPPNWTANDVRVASFGMLEKEENDMLFITDRKYKDVLMRAQARYKIFYHVSLHHKARKMVTDKRLHVFACSTNVARYDRLLFGVKPFLAAGGVNTALFYPKGGDGENGRMGEGERGERERREERGERGVTIMIYGRLSEKVKGTQLAVKACERLYKKFPNIRLLLFDTPVNESMAKAIENFKSSVPFEFITHHPVEKNVTLFHRADIFVAAEKGAGWANTVAEAMACGIPVVATRSGTADILINRETGLLVRRNAASIARGIRELIQSPGLRQQLAANGRKHIEQFDWHILANRIISWYGDMESKRQSPDHS